MASRYKRINFTGRAWYDVVFPLSQNVVDNECVMNNFRFLFNITLPRKNGPIPEFLDFEVSHCAAFGEVVLERLPASRLTPYGNALGFSVTDSQLSFPITFQLPPERPLPSASDMNCTFEKEQFDDWESGTAKARMVLWDIFRDTMNNFLRLEVSRRVQECMEQYQREAMEALFIDT